MQNNLAGSVGFKFNNQDTQRLFEGIFNLAEMIFEEYEARNEAESRIIKELHAELLQIKQKEHSNPIILLNEILYPYILGMIKHPVLQGQALVKGFDGEPRLPGFFDLYVQLYVNQATQLKLAKETQVNGSAEAKAKKENKSAGQAALLVEIRDPAKPLKQVPPDIRNQLDEKFKIWQTQFTQKLDRIKHKTVQAKASVTNQLREDRKHKLKPVSVYYASRNLNPKKMVGDTHGFIATGEPKNLKNGKRNPKEQARLLNKVSYDYLKVPITISTEMCALAKEKLSSVGKSEQYVQLEKFKGRYYATIEYFLRDYFQALAKAGIDTPLYNEAEGFFSTLGFPKYYKELFQVLVKITNNKSVYIFGSDTENRIDTGDRQAFNNGDVSYKKQDVSLLYLHEAIADQRLYQRYLLAVMGLSNVEDESTNRKTRGKTNEVLEKNKILDPDRIEKLSDKLVKYKAVMPNKKSANCNKMTATFLAAAKNKQAKKPLNAKRKVKSGTFFSHGSNDRVFLHDPLAINRKKK